MRLVAIFVIITSLLSAQITQVPASSSGGGTWGTITGTLTDQSDLNTALGLRVLTSASILSNAFHTSNSAFDWSGTVLTLTDVGISRNAAGVLEVNTGTAGTFRDLKFRSMQLTTRAEPTCDSSSRGTIDYVAGASGADDTLRICAKDASNTYAYRTLF